MKQPIIEWDQFSFKYQSQQAPTLKDITLTIYEGEKVVIVGPSGSGKSTLAQCLNGIIPTIQKGEATGSLRIKGQEAFSSTIYDKSLLVSTVLQDTDGQFIGLSVAEDLAFALENDCVPTSEMKQTVADWAERLELEQFLHHRPQDLSGGQKQRVSLAGVLIDESPILLFDEPLANLDPKSGQDTIDLIDRLHKEEGATTVIIEHRLEDVLYREVDRIVLINDGEIVYNGDVEGLIQSDLLRKNGIREPLYITTLRYLGVAINQLPQVTPLSALALSDANLPSLSRLSDVAEEKETLVTVKDLSVSYGERTILAGLDMMIRKGERLAIVGKNGAGKSTLAKALCQFVPSNGQMLWESVSVRGDSIKERAERIGYVLQNPNQMISQTMIFDEVAQGLRLRGVSDKEVTERVHTVLEVCGLYAYRNWPISALSFGQKKRVTIASILVLNPDVLLLDEPTAGQDEAHYTEIMSFLEELHQRGHTIVMITHDMQLMLDYSDRALVMVDGRIIADATPAEVLTNPQLIAQANLKETSIFQLARQLNLDPIALTQFYMARKGTD